MAYNFDLCSIGGSMLKFLRKALNSVGVGGKEGGRIGFKKEKHSDQREAITRNLEFDRSYGEIMKVFSAKGLLVKNHKNEFEIQITEANTRNSTYIEITSLFPLKVFRADMTKVRAILRRKEGHQ